MRSQHDLPRAFAVEALEEAFSAEPQPSDRRDLRELPFVAIDPPGSSDLDQAVFIEERPNGFRVWYAIADVGAFVTPGGALDVAARSRGVTIYFPDGRIPLHPRILSEDRASLLPQRDRPAIVWRFDLGEDATIETSHLERATVHVADAISYQQAQASLANDRRLQLLETVGRRRSALEAERGGISLD
ncbi:MAG: RNB domain-containing ribonuclease, partial [Acidimicrobiia bacterium]|nr:RNB domain-containing ribonuclease [Acidimicrobiia bacterium]